MAQTLYQSGLAKNVFLNGYVNGTTEEQKFTVNFENPMNFQNSTIQAVKGWVKLKAHAISGTVRMAFRYSPMSISIPGPAATRGGTPDPVKPPSLEGTPTGSKRTRSTDEEEDEEEIRPKRVKRVTTVPPSPVIGVLPVGATLTGQMRFISEQLNKTSGGGARYSKMSYWPCVLVITEDNYTRYESSVFATLALTSVRHWTALGYDDSQIQTITHKDFQKLYTLKLGVDNQCVSFDPAPDLMVKLDEPCQFIYFPTEGSVELSSDFNLSEVDATPERLTEVLQEMILETNAKYRFSMLNEQFIMWLIFPTGVRTYRGFSVLDPLTLFPISAMVSDTGDSITLRVNTKVGAGSVSEVRFEQDNPFGMNEYYRTVDEVQKKLLRSQIVSTHPLGVGDQECIVTSLELALNRATVVPYMPGKTLVAVFNKENKEGYYPPNALCAGTSYNSITFDVVSNHAHKSLRVTKECFRYSICFEIRSYD